MKSDKLLKHFFITSIIIIILFITLFFINQKFRDRISVIKNNLVITIYKNTKKKDEVDG